MRTDKKMAERGRRGIAVCLIAGMVLCGGCGKKDERAAAQTPEEAAGYVLESLQTLDLETFNAYTDNYVCTDHNWIGMPTESRYQVFNELLGRRRSGKRYEGQYAFSQKLVEHLSWEVLAVREEGGETWIDLAVTNTDMTDVMGEYTVYLLRQMTENEGTGIRALVRELRELENGMDALTAIVDEQDDGKPCTMEVAVRAYQEDGTWKLHISDVFVNAFMGNLNTEEFSPDVEAQIAELEHVYEERLDEWGEDVEERVEKMFM